MAESWNEPERRRYPRVEVVCPVLCTTTECRSRSEVLALGKTIDISPGGVKVDVHLFKPLGTATPVRVVIRDAWLDVEGKVVHTASRKDNRQVLGIEFEKRIKYFCLNL